MSYDPQSKAQNLSDTLDSSGEGGAAPAPTISVIIPTYTMDRWDYLIEAIASAQTQTVPALEVIVVVDHNPELLERIQRDLPDVVAIPNIGSRGVSGARNSGVKASRGEIIAFLDDDAIGAPEWLATLLQHVLRPDVVGAGCYSDGLWESPRPAWFPHEFNWTVGISYPAMPQVPSPIRNVWTSSMLVKRAAFEQVDGFREDFGKIGSKNVPEDTDLCLRISSAHEDTVWIYDPARVMQHRVPAGRATVGYLLSRCFLQGWGKAAMASKDGFEESTSMERSYMFRTLPMGVLRGVGETARGDAAGVLRSCAIVASVAATATGYAWYLLESRLPKKAAA